MFELAAVCLWPPLGGTRTEPTPMGVLLRLDPLHEMGWLTSVVGLGYMIYV